MILTKKQLGQGTVLMAVLVAAAVAVLGLLSKPAALAQQKEPGAGGELAAAPLEVLDLSGVGLTKDYVECVQDAYIDEASPDSNFDTVILAVSRDETTYRERHILVQFDVPALPANTAVVSAALELYYPPNREAEPEAGELVMWADAVRESWQEGTVTWSDAPLHTYLGDPSADDSDPGHVTWDVTRIARAWLHDGLANNGILIRPDPSTTGASSFESSEKPEYTPRLILTFGQLDAPLEVYRMAMQWLESKRGTDQAPGWEEADLGLPVRPVYRPDESAPAYYDFPVVTPSNPNAGFIIVSATHSDAPVSHWSYEGVSPTEYLRLKALDVGETAARYWRLDSASYLAENGLGEPVATRNGIPYMLTGMDPDWIVDPPEPTTITFTPGVSILGDDGAATLTHTLTVEGPGFPASVQLSSWPSWSALRAGYAENYAGLIQHKRNKVADLWAYEESNRTQGIPLFTGDVYELPVMWASPEVTLTGDEGLGLVDIEEIPRAGLLPLLRITVLDTIAGEAVPFKIKLVYDNGFEELFKFLVIQPMRVYLPTVMRNSFGLPRSGTMQAAVGTLGVAAVEGGVYVGTEADQVWYRQLQGGEDPNTDWCPSGCGATAWSMLFGWVDRMADQQLYNHPDWRGRWGLFREQGGRYTPDAVAPKTFEGDGVKNMTWEIREDINTFCADPTQGLITQNAPTPPTDMQNVREYIEGRSGVSVEWGWEMYDTNDSLIKATTKILGGDGFVRTPAIIGIGYLEHFPLAFGWNGEPRTFCAWLWPPTGCITLYYGEFLVNMGHAEGKAEWYADEDIWFVGTVQPHTAWQDNLGVYSGNPNNVWLYDYRHDGDYDEFAMTWGDAGELEAWPFGLAGDWTAAMDDIGFFLASVWDIDAGRDGTSSTLGGSWGREGDLPFVGDFNRDGKMENLGFYRPSDHKWYHMLGSVPPTTKYVVGPWGEDGDLPLTGDFDRDGLADDVGVFRPSTQMWYYDYNHDGTTQGTSGPWGQPGDLPVGGDFDNDGQMDDVAVFRNAEHMWYFDHDHNGTTDSTAPWSWGDHDLWKEAKPFVGDFDGGGMVNDVGLLIDGRHWVIDYEHDGLDPYPDTMGDETLPRLWGWWGEKEAKVISLDYDRDGARDDIGYLQDVIWRFNTDHRNPGETQSFTTFAGGQGVTAEPSDRPIAGDFNGDGYSDDVGFFRPSTRVWYYDYYHTGYINASSGQWGWSEDLPVVGDFDSDGLEDDLALFRPTDRKWRYDYDHDGTQDATSGPWGQIGYLPAAGDFDHDGYTDDLALYAPSSGDWYIDINHNSSSGSDLVVPGYACDGCQPIVGAFGFH